MESNRGVFAEVLRELFLSTHCVRLALEHIAEHTSWDGYLIDFGVESVDVHAMDKRTNVCCRCANWFGDDFDSTLDSAEEEKEEDLESLPKPVSFSNRLSESSTAPYYQEGYGFRTAHYPSFDVPYTFSDHVFVKDEENGGLALIPKREAFRRAMGRSLDDSSEDEEEESPQEKKPPPAG